MHYTLRCLVRPAKHFISQPFFCASYSKRGGPVIDSSEPFRMKVIPKDIWLEEKDERYTGTEEVNGRWQYVERLFPKLRIPEPPKKVSSTGWKAPEEGLPDLPYYVARSRNHMLPVYQSRAYKDRVLTTQVSKVQGDIYMLELDLKTYLEEKLGEKVESHVNEITCSVKFKGNHIPLITEWLYQKGF